MNGGRQDGANEPVCGGGTFYAVLLLKSCGKSHTFFYACNRSRAHCVINETTMALKVGYHNLGPSYRYRWAQGASFP